MYKAKELDEEPPESWESRSWNIVDPLDETESSYAEFPEQAFNVTAAQPSHERFSDSEDSDSDGNTDRLKMSVNSK